MSESEDEDENKIDSEEENDDEEAGDKTLSMTQLRIQSYFYGHFRIKRVVVIDWPISFSFSFFLNLPLSRYLFSVSFYCIIVSCKH